MVVDNNEPNTSLRQMTLEQVEVHLLAKIAAGEIAPDLWSEAHAAKLLHGNHESDLYLDATPEARSLMQKYDVRATCEFTCNICRKRVIDIYGMYTPFWYRRLA